MRHDEIPIWTAQRDKRYGSMIVREDMAGYKKGNGVIVIYADDQTANLAGAAPDAMRLLVNLVLSKDEKDGLLTKWKVDARKILALAGIDIWDFTLPGEDHAQPKPPSVSLFGDKQ